jgi:hypothetical protein
MQYIFTYTSTEELQNKLQRAKLDKGFLEQMVKKSKETKDALSNYQNQLRKEEEYIRCLEEELYKRVFSGVVG